MQRVAYIMGNTNLMKRILLTKLLHKELQWRNQDLFSGEMNLKNVFGLNFFFKYLLSK